MSVPAVHRFRLDDAARGRWSAAFRVVAAVVGGYTLTSLVTLTLSLALPWLGVNRAEAVLAATIVSFLVYVAIIMGVFHARTAWRAWAGLGLGAIPCIAVIALSKLTGGF